MDVCSSERKARDMVSEARYQVHRPAVLVPEGSFRAGLGPEAGEVVTGKILLRTYVSVTGAVREYHLRELLVEVFVGEVLLCKSLLPPVGEEYVRALQELEQSFLALGILEVEDYALLAAVVEVEAGVLIGAGAAPFGCSGETVRISVLCLYLYYFRALVRQELAYCGHCDECRKLDNFYTFEWFHLGLLFLPADDRKTRIDSTFILYSFPRMSMFFC